jgi:predicted lactoylglutathione lyase
MAKTIFVNLPVTDVVKSTVFYEAIGFEKDARFSNEQGSALRWADGVSFMVTDKAFFTTLTSMPVADTRATSSAAFALGLDSRTEVDAIVEKAIAAGGREGHPPEDHGFMYSRAFYDPDGHAFGPMWMDVDAALAAIAQPEPAAA